MNKLDLITKIMALDGDDLSDEQINKLIKQIKPAERGEELKIPQFNSEELPNSKLSDGLSTGTFSNESEEKDCDSLKRITVPHVIDHFGDYEPRKVILNEQNNEILLKSNSINDFYIMVET